MVQTKGSKITRTVKKVVKKTKDFLKEGKKDAEYVKSGKAKKKRYALPLEVRAERIASEGIQTPKTKAQLAKNKKIVAARKKKAKAKKK